jgi:hypothetical protein
LSYVFRRPFPAAEQRRRLNATFVSLLVSTGGGAESGAGASSGANTATAVGAWLQSGVGSAAGSNTSSATAAPIQAKVGSAAGTDTAAGVGHWLQSGDGASAGANTASATAAPIQAKVGSAAGANTTAGVGAWLQSGAGSSAGSDTASATAAPIQAKVGSAAGANTTTAIGSWLQSGVGSSVGSDTATAVPSLVTWNPSDKDSNITLSNGNLTASLSTSIGALTGVDARATSTFTSGYWEITFTTLVTGQPHGVGIGFSNSSQVLNHFPQGPNSIGYFSNGFVAKVSGSTTVTGFAQGDVVGAWLVGDGSLQYFVNGVNVYTDTTIPTGNLYPVVCLANDTESGTANFGAAPMAYLPYGVKSWDQSQTGTAKGSAAGANAATAVGAWLQAGVGSAAGTNTAAGSLSGVAVTWDPLNKYSGITLSNSNLTATLIILGPNDVQARGTTTRSAGYFESVFSSLDVSSGSSSSVGLMNASAPFDHYIGSGNHTGIAYFRNGNVMFGGIGIATVALYGVGDVIGVELTATPSVKFYKNGTLVYTATSFPSGSLYPGVSLSRVGDAETTNFGATSMSYLPAGATSWDGSQTAGTAGVISSAGSNTATAVGAWIKAGTGTSVGSNTANAAVLASDFNNDYDQSFAGFPGAETGLGTGDFNNDFNNDFPVYAAAHVVSGTGTAAGGNIAAAVSSAAIQGIVSAVGTSVGGNTATAVSLVTVVAPTGQVWHPAQEYHKVQAPAATRVFKTGTDLRRATRLSMTRVARTGTEMRRLTPQGMKRRYG